MSSPVAAWVLEEACRQGRAWCDLGHRVRLGVNLSPSQLQAGDLAATVADVLQRTGGPAPQGLRARWLPVALVFGLAVASLALFNRNAGLDDTAFYFFGTYGLGMLVFWIGRATRYSTWQSAIALLALVGAGALAIDWRSRIATALVTALLIAIAQRRNWLSPKHWPAGRAGE